MAAANEQEVDNLDKDENPTHNRVRWYEAKYPKQDELVYVQVLRVEELAAGVQLLEYGNIEGMVQLSELTRRRIRSMNRLIRVGKFEALVVLRVDPEKGYIDLSKRRVSLEDVKKCEEKYNKSKSVHSILRHTSQTEKVPLDQLYSEFAWPLYKKFTHAYDALEMIAKQERDRVSELQASPNLTPEQLNEALSNRWLNEMNIDPKLRDAYLKDILSNLAYVNQLLGAMEARVKNALLQNIKNRLTPQITKIRCDLEVSCFKYEGIDAIQAALKAGEACGTKDTPISIKLVAPPLYVVMCNTLEITKGIELLKRARDTIRDEIRARGGDMNVKVEPRAVNARDEKQLAETFETLEKLNQEVAGDDPDVD